MIAFADKSADFQEPCIVVIDVATYCVLYAGESDADAAVELVDGTTFARGHTYEAAYSKAVAAAVNAKRSAEPKERKKKHAT